MKILLHLCCSNCALYPYRILKSGEHDVTGLWFNPNIHPFDEYASRLGSLKKLSDAWKFDVLYMEEYRPEDYFGMFDIHNPDRHSLPPPDAVPPSPKRCTACYQLRLEKTAGEARKQGFDAFSTTLLISPYQDYEQLAFIGKKVAARYDVLFYLKDFRPSFRDAMNLARDLGLYRQNYCGCIFSREERKRKKKVMRFK